MNNKTSLPILFFLAVFLTAQYSSVIHASEHEFHEDEITCDVYQLVDRASDALIDHSLSLGDKSNQGLYTSASVEDLFKDTTVARSRSPPDIVLL